MPKNALKELLKHAGKLEKKRGSVLVPLLMDETRSIDHYSVSEIYEHLEKGIKGGACEKMDVILHSEGGDADCAYHLAIILQEMCEGELTMIIPRYAKSAATMVACGGDVIAMGLPSELGPVDPQIQDPTSGRWISSSSIYNTIDYLKTLPACPLLQEMTKRLPVMEIGDHERQIKHVYNDLKRLLVARMFKGDEDKEKEAHEVADKLAKGYEYHGKAITLREAREMGLKVEELPEDQWKSVWRIFRIFEKEALL